MTTYSGACPRVCLSGEFDAKRWRWTAFGYADLRSFRLTKILLDFGLSWDAASSIAGDSILWKSHQSSDDAIQYLVISNQGAEFYPCNREQLTQHFSAGDIERPVMTVIDLEHLRRDVVFRCRAATLRAVATDLKQTSHISVRSGPDLLSPQEAAERKQAIEKLADKSMHWPSPLLWDKRFIKNMRRYAVNFKS